MGIDYSTVSQGRKRLHHRVEKDTDILVAGQKNYVKNVHSVRSVSNFTDLDKNPLQED